MKLSNTRVPKEEGRSVCICLCVVSILTLLGLVNCLLLALYASFDQDFHIQSSVNT